MPAPKPQKNNQLVVFLNEYFNVVLFIAILIIFGVSYVLFIGPKFKITTTIIRENIEAQQRLYVEQEKRLRDLKTIIKIYDEISPSDLNKFDGILPNNYIKEVLFGELEEIIIQQGFLIQTVIIEADDEAANNRAQLPQMGGAPVSGANVGAVRLVISLGAIDYNGLKQLLRIIETNSRLFDVEQVSFSDATESAQLELVTYYYKNIQP